MQSNLVEVYCGNAACPDYRKPKSVGMVHLGQDVYLDGPKRCGVCNTGAEMYNAASYPEPVTVPEASDA